MDKNNARSVVSVNLVRGRINKANVKYTYGVVSGHHTGSGELSQCRRR